MTKISRSPLRAIVVVTLIVAAAMTILISSSGIALRIAKKSAPLVDASMNVKYHLSLYHLWFEELVQQDPAVNREKVWQHLNQTRWYANAMLEGGESQDEQYSALDDPTLRFMINNTLAHLEQLETVGLARLEHTKTSLAGSEHDQLFDNIFTKALQTADDTEKAVQRSMAAQIKQFEALVYILGVVVILVGLAGGFTFFLFERRRKSDYASLLESREELGRKQALLKEAQAFAHIGNWELDPVTKKAVWSDEIFHIFGIEASDDVGPERLSTLLHPDDREAVLSCLQCAATDGHQHHLEYRVVRPDNELRWIDCRVRPVLDENGKLFRLRGVIQDITRRKLDELQLQESEARFRSIFEGAPEGVWLIGSDRRTIEVNRCLCGILGYQREEMIGKPPLDFVDEKNRKIFIEQTGKIETTERREYEIELRHKDGHNIPTFFRATTLHTKSGGVLEAVAFVTDLKDQKIAEQALRRAQKMDALGQLTGGIAHDFNNILGIIIGNLSFLKQQVAGDEKAIDRVDTVYKAALRAADLTKQLLGFSRMQGQEMLTTNINQVILGMDSLITRSVTPEVEVEIHLADDLWLVEIDSGDFEDALLNLVLNARDAMLQGGKLTIETSNKRLDDAYTGLNPTVTPGDYLQLVVSDTGSGIPKEIIDDVFEPFFTTKPRGKGTGLGLSMVYGFAQQSKGYVRAYSEPGVGTCIRLYLPRSLRKVRNTLEIAATQSQPAQGHETILVVDDEADLIDLAREYLEEVGYSVHTAAKGPEALAILESGVPINLLFSDVVMPGGMNGYELAEQACERNPNLKVVLTSGFTEKAAARNGQAHFAANMLSKPYSRDDLIKRIRGSLDGE